jgi:hypothetical protein
MVPAHQNMYRNQAKQDTPLEPGHAAVAASTTTTAVVVSQVATDVNMGIIMPFGGNIPVLSPTEQTFSTQPNCSVNYPVLSAMQSSANPNPVFRWMPPLPYPPHYSNPYNKKNLNFIATKILHDWYAANIHYPYPSNEEVQHLAQQGGVTEAQVRKWLANRRLRTGNTYRYNNIKRCKRQQRYIENELIKAQQFCFPSMGMYRMESQHIPNSFGIANTMESQNAFNTGNFPKRSSE